MGLGDSYLSGYKSWLGVVQESTWGTPLTVTSFLEYNTESLNKKQEGHQLEAIGSTGRNVQKRYLGNVVVEGSVEGPLNIFADAVALIINNAIGGSVTSSGDAGTGYNHAVAQGEMASGTTSLTMTKRVGDSGDMFQFAGCRVNTLTIKGEVGTPEIMLTAEIIGQDGTITTDALTVALAAEDPLLWNGVTYEVADTTTSFDGSTNAESIQSFELTYNNNLEAGDASRNLGSNLLGVLPVGRASCTLKVTQRYETSTAYSRAFDETDRAVRISMDSGVTVGSTGTTGSLMITLPKAYVETDTVIPETGEAGVIQHDVTWAPLQPTTAQEFIECEYNNNTASY